MPAVNQTQRCGFEILGNIQHQAFIIRHFSDPSLTRKYHRQKHFVLAFLKVTSKDGRKNNLVQYKKTPRTLYPPFWVNTKLKIPVSHLKSPNWRNLTNRPIFLCRKKPTSCTWGSKKIVLGISEVFSPPLLIKKKAPNMNTKAILRRWQGRTDSC